MHITTNNELKKICFISNIGTHRYFTSNYYTGWYIHYGHILYFRKIEQLKPHIFFTHYTEYTSITDYKIIVKTGGGYINTR